MTEELSIGGLFDGAESFGTVEEAPVQESGSVETPAEESPVETGPVESVDTPEAVSEPAPAAVTDVEETTVVGETPIEAPATTAPATGDLDQWTQAIAEMNRLAAAARAGQGQEETGPPQEFQFVDEEVLPSVVMTAKGMNGFGTAVVKTALQAMPAIVNAIVEQRLHQERAVASFWAENQDLAPFKDILALDADQLAKQHPDKSVQEILKLTADGVRARLKTQTKVEKPPVAPPPVAPAPAVKPKAPVVSEFAKQLREVF